MMVLNDNFFSPVYSVLFYIPVVIFFYTLFVIGGCTDSYAELLDLPFGIASGDVTSNSVILWSKTNGTAYMNIEISTTDDFKEFSRYYLLVNESTEFTGHYKVEELNPNSTYFYRIWFSSINDSSILSKMMTGKFNTAPSANMEKNISFIVGGDIGGQGFCKRADIGYSIFTVIRSLDPNFFVANGDMIYADSVCPHNGPINSKGWINIDGNFKGIKDPLIDWENKSEIKEVYEGHWGYNKRDLHYQKLYQFVPVYSQADDHEVIDNYSGNSSIYNNSTHGRKDFKNLVDQGLISFITFSPVDIDPNESTRIYKKINWGKNLDVFILDSHQYRTSGTLPNNLENKTLLGKEQLQWLKTSLLNSKTTWKVILNTVPFSIPNCNNNNENGCDNWATDNKSKFTFSKERNDLLKFLDEKNIKNLIYISTDVHYPSNILINEDFDNDGDLLKMYEFTSGPLNAETFEPVRLDPTLNATYLFKESGFFNFGYYLIEKKSDNKNHFISEVWTADGLKRKSSHIDLIPE